MNTECRCREPRLFNESHGFPKQSELFITTVLSCLSLRHRMEMSVIACFSLHSLVWRRISSPSVWPTLQRSWHMIIVIESSLHRCLTMPPRSHTRLKSLKRSWGAPLVGQEGCLRCLRRKPLPVPVLQNCGQNQATQKRNGLPSKSGSPRSQNRWSGV
ncbi:hypothetical protein F5887DRAFT_241363 [Amanita rubescens]|nr:hypothetical protein F5887DRAFT_241363 [Amanita rubescens]